MHKHGFMPVLFSLFFGFMFLGIVEDDGAGSGEDDNNDVGDENIDDENLDDGKKDKDKPKDKKDESPASALSDEDREALEELKTSKALTSITNGIKKRHPEFDSSAMDKIVTHLKEMDTKDKGSGQELFNAAGIELTYLNEFKNASEDDPAFEGGRGGRETSLEELTTKVKNGNANPHEREALFLKLS